MKIDNNIESEIAKTLRSLDEITEVKARPYFYMRLSAKMSANESQVDHLWKWSLTAMTVVILINIVSLLSLWPATVETEEAIDLMAAEYSLTQVDIYTTTLE